MTPKTTSKQQAVLDKDEVLKAIDAIKNTANADERLDRIETFLYYGNGDSLKEWMGIMTTKMDGVLVEVAKIEPLKQSVDIHHKTPHLWSWLSGVKFYGILLGGFIVAHTLVTYAPNVWNAVMLLAGFPHLVLPLNKGG